jgi:hypothetical protein
MQTFYQVTAPLLYEESIVADLHSFFLAASDKADLQTNSLRAAVKYSCQRYNGNQVQRPASHPRSPLTSTLRADT